MAYDVLNRVIPVPRLWLQQLLGNISWVTFNAHCSHRICSDKVIAVSQMSDSADAVNQIDIQQLRC